MKMMGILSSAVLALLLGAAPGFAQQDEKHDQQQDRPQERQQAPEKRDQNAPGAQQQARPEANRPAQNDREREQMERRPQEERHDQVQQPNQQPMERQQREQRNDTRQDQRAIQQDNREDRREDQRSQEMRGNAGGRRQVAHGQRIPEDRFRATFGREHHFHIQRPVIVEGAPQFVYGGYTFVLADPWPAEWAYTDDFYVDYIDDTYYLFDPFHPGIQIALNIIM